MCAQMNFYNVAQELLMAVCMNCDQHTTHDVEVMSALCKIRLKNRLGLNHYLDCIRELLAQHPDNLKTLVTHAVYNELSQSRNPNNMALLSTVFSQNSEAAAKVRVCVTFSDGLGSRTYFALNKKKYRSS